MKDKEAIFAVASMTADTQLRNRDIKGFCDNPYFHFASLPKNTTSLHRNSSKKTLKSVKRIVRYSAP